MKRTIIAIAAVICAFAIVSCEKNTAYNVNSNKDFAIFQHNISQHKVREIAAKHGFVSGSIALKEKAIYQILCFLDSARITCCSESTLDKEFSEVRKMIEQDKVYDREDSIFNVKKHTVTSYKDYYDLINSLPVMRRSTIESLGSELLYQQQVDSLCKLTVNVYMGPDGVLTFIPPELDNGHDTPDGKYNGKRLNKNNKNR